MKKVLNGIRTHRVAGIQSQPEDLMDAVNQYYVDSSIPTDGEISTTSKAGLGTLNPNPTFVLGDADYENYVPTAHRTIVQDVVDGTAGSLRVHGGGGTLLGYHYLPVDLTKEYRARFHVKSYFSDGNQDPNKTYTMKTYIGVRCYDSDELFIRYYHIYARTGTETTIVNDINNGDTDITIVDGSSWSNSSTGHLRSLAMLKKQNDGTFRYIGNNGRLYDNDGYTRWVIYDKAYNKNDITDNGDGTWNIKLKNPWNLGHFSAGDRIRNTKGGSTQQYWYINPNIPVDDTWVRGHGAWKSYDFSAPPKSTYNDIFRNGTSYCKLVLLPNNRVFEDGTQISAWDYGGVISHYSVVALEWRYKAND